jgi:sugar phosphate isomerase/epimerase
MLESGAALGAKRAICLGFDPNPQRMLDNFGRLCQLAAEFRMSVDVEFIAFSSINSLDAALRLLQSSGQTNTGLILDPLHLTRSGGVPADIARVLPALIGYAQICDGPLTMPADRQMLEGSEQRQIPGEGQFPLRQFVDALPKDVLIGVEIPLRDRVERGMGALERAKLAVDASRKLIEA